MENFINNAPFALVLVCLVIGFVLLIKGADFFVEGSSSAAKRLHVPSIIIGLTIVAMGTSLPETAVSVSASLTGNNELAVSNVIGSNIFNLMVVIGVCAVLTTVEVAKETIKRDIPLSLICAGLLMVLGISGLGDKSGMMLGEEIVNKLNISPLLGKSLFALSGGQKQKIACASVATLFPEVLVMDEPSSNLDIEAIYELAEIIREWKKEGKTVVIAEHRLYWLMDIADRVIYIKEGEILQDITIDEFKKLSTNTLEKMGLRSRKISFDNIQTPVIESQDYIHFKDFSFAYEKEKNMDIKSLMIPCGSVVAIIGKNGAGKSTFGRCMCGLEKKVKGTMTFYGKELNWKERIKNCYLVMQDVNHQLFTESVLEEILLSMENYADNESVKKANAIKILKALNLEKFQEVHPMSLSGGQKQRVSVACALASDKKILVYDEPTSGLDYTRMLDVAEAIKSMQKRGRTQFVITHDPELIEKCCDYVMFMDKGGVIDVGTIEEERLHRIKKFFRV